MDAFEKVRAIGRAVLDFPDRVKETHPACIEGERLMDAGKHAEAEECFQKAASELKANAAPRARQARVLLRLAQAQHEQKKLADARSSAEAAHEHLSARRKPSGDLAACLDLLGRLDEAGGDADNARKRFREALEIQKKASPIQPALLTERHRRLASSLIAADVEEARTHYKKAIELAEKRLGTGATVTADCLLDLGRFELLHGDKEGGVAALERAIDIHKENSGEVSDEVARSLQFAATACQQAGDLERSVSYYEHALKVRERQLGGSASDFATLLMGLAETHTLLGNDAPAMELLQEAVGKLASTGGERYAAALESLGEVYAGLNRFPEAISCFKKARVIWEKNPQVYAQPLEVNSALLDHAMHYVPPEPGVPGPLFKFGSRTREHPPRLTPQPDTFAATVHAQETGFPFGFSQPSYSQPGFVPPVAAPVPVAWVGVNFVAEPAAGTPPSQPAPPGHNEMAVNSGRIAEAPPVISPLAMPPSAMPPSAMPAPAAAAAAPPAPAIPAAIPENVGGSSLLVSFVNRDGSPVAAPPAATNEPVQMTIIVPEEGMPKQAVLAPTAPAEPEAKPPELSGWDELSFEYLPLQ